MNKRILVFGADGRAASYVWRLTSEGNDVFSLNGLAGMADDGAVLLSYNKTDHTKSMIEQIVWQSKRLAVDLVLISPELTLVAGVVDAVREAGLKIVGPNKKAARFEGSKRFAKRFMRRHNIPTADFHVVTNLRDALAFIRRPKWKVYVIKPDGLTGGKGVLLPDDYEAAVAYVTELMSGKYEGAGKIIVFEERMQGPEGSYIALSDGHNTVPFPPFGTRDHKRRFDGDRGSNTGGMGAFTHIPELIEDPDLLEVIHEGILNPLIRETNGEEAPYDGFIYAGLMFTADGPKVVEFNCRAGDPEIEPTLPLLENFTELLFASTEPGGLKGAEGEWSDQFGANVVLVQKPYPGTCAKDAVISGIDEARKLGALVFHAGTALSASQVRSYVATGGRVLNVVGVGDSREEALRIAYAGAQVIQFEGKDYRRDIGKPREKMEWRG